MYVMYCNVGTYARAYVCMYVPRYIRTYVRFRFRTIMYDYVQLYNNYVCVCVCVRLCDCVCLQVAENSPKVPSSRLPLRNGTDVEVLC